MSGFLFKSHDCREGDTRGCLLQGVSGDPGECQFWPFDPGTSQYTVQQPLDTLQLVSIWRATCSSSLLPGQHGSSQSEDTPLSWPRAWVPVPSFYAGDFSTASGAPLVTLSCPYTCYNCYTHARKGAMGDRVLHGGIKGCRKFGCYWPFDPGPLHHRVQLTTLALQGSIPFKCPLQQGLNVLTQYTQLW